MSLKAIYKNQEEIPEQLKDFYTEKNDQWELQAEGMKTEEDVRRVQEVVRKLTEEKKDLKKKVEAYGDLDPKSVRTTLDEYEVLKARVEAGSGPDEEKLAQIKKTLENQIKNPLVRELEEIRTRAATAEAKATSLEQFLSRSKIEGAIRQAAIEAKMRPEAVEDALRWGMDEFAVDDKGGVTVKDGADVGFSAAQWMENKKATRQHWWPESQGAGSKGSGVAGHAGPNPFAPGDGFSVTEQMRLIKTNPKLAELLEKAASKK